MLTLPSSPRYTAIGAAQQLAVGRVALIQRSYVETPGEGAQPGFQKNRIDQRHGRILLRRLLLAAVDAEFGNLARDRVAPDAESQRRLDPPTAGARQGARNQDAFENL